MSADKLEFLKNSLQNIVEDYYECFDERIGSDWEEEYGDDSWGEFEELYKKVKIKVFVEE